MSGHKNKAVRLTSIAALGLVSCLASTARAQPAPPNPFEDYEHFAAGEPAAVTPGVPSALGIKLRTAPWTWTIGLRSQLSFSRITYQRGEGHPDGAQTALLFRLSPAIGVFVYERLQVGISAGLLARSAGNNIGDDATDANLLIEATAQYFTPLSPRFSFVPGLGLGGYFGAGTRKTDAIIPNGPHVRVDRDSKPSGMSLALYMGIAYQLDEHLQIRSGLSGNVYFGWDYVQGEHGRVQNSAVHVGIPVELFYVF